MRSKDIDELWRPISELSDCHQDGRWILFFWNMYDQFYGSYFCKFSDGHWQDARDGRILDSDILECDHFMEIPCPPVFSKKITKEWQGKYVKLRGGLKGYVCYVFEPEDGDPPPYNVLGFFIMNSYDDSSDAQQSHWCSHAWCPYGGHIAKSEDVEDYELDIIGLWEE